MKIKAPSKAKPIPERKIYHVTGIKPIPKCKTVPKQISHNFILPAATPAITQKKWTDADFEIITEIGKGRYGTVYKAKHKNSGKFIALKEVKFETINQNDCFEQIKSEIEINSRLLHPNIARLYGFFSSSDKLTMVLDFISGGDLFTKLLQSGGYLSEPECAFVLDQLIDALIYLRNRHIIHRDIKPENVLLTKNSSGDIINAKLCDFTWAAHSINERRITICGTLGYCAPEMACSIDYDNKVDVWSTGVLLFQILTGTLIIGGNKEDDFQKSMQSLKIIFPEKPEITDGAKNLVHRILSKNPEDRPSLEKIKIDSWLLINVARYKAFIEEKSKQK